MSLFINSNLLLHYYLSLLARSFQQRNRKFKLLVQQFSNERKCKLFVFKLHIYTALVKNIRHLINYYLTF